MSTEEIYNAIKVNDRLVTAGQPTEDQLAAAKTEGFATVINLAPSDSRNALADEAGTVRALGMNYNHIPVQWDDPQQSDFTAFEQAMEQRPEGENADSLRGELSSDGFLFALCTKASWLDRSPG